MAEERAGSFIIDAKGNAVPNPDDEAMAERHGLKKKETQKKTPVPTGGGGEEVKKDA